MGILHAGIVNALPQCRIVAVCESDPLMTTVAKKVLPSYVSFYKNIRDMVNDDRINAVFITSPIHTHAQIVRDILEASREISIFSEKPLAANASDAHEVAEAVGKRGITNLVGYHKRFSPVLKRAKELIDAKSIGELRSLACYSYSSDIFTQGKGWRFKKGTGGVLLDLAPHLLDLLLWYFGEPLNASGNKQSLYSAEVEDKVHATVTFQSGLHGTMDISWSESGYRLPEIRIEVQGASGSMVVTDDYVSINVQTSGGAVPAGKHEYQKPEFDTSVDILLADPEYTIEDKIFMRAVVDGGPVEPNFQTAAKVNDFVELINRKTTV